MYIPEPEHPEDLVPAEEEAPIEAYITKVASAPTPPLPPPSFLPILIQTPHTRAAMAQRRAAAPSTYHSLLPSRTPRLLPISLLHHPLAAEHVLEADMPLRRRLLLTAPIPRVRDTERRTMAAVEVVKLRVSYQADVRRRESLEALEARIRVLETHAYRHEWQRQDADDRAIEHIIRTQALEAEAHVDTLEDTGSSA
ncbi:hypothetical protein Tco_1238469 [Tanacetum coccineum]